MIVTSFPDRKITLNNKEYLYFGGTSYLGMASNKKFQAQLCKSILQWGTFYGSSRKSNIQLQVYDDFETFFSKQIKAAKTVTVSSGTLAGKLTIDFLSRKKHIFYHYPKTHPAILAKNSTPLFVDKKLHPNLQNNTPEEVVITADSILGLEVKATDFGFLSEISSAKKITLVIDESHSLGVLGNQKMGVFNQITAKNIHRKIAVSSLGKGLGLAGGIIASDAQFINQIKNEVLFVAAAAANPAYLDCYIKSQKIYQQQQQKLQNNIDFVFQKVGNHPQLIMDSNYPVIYSFNEEMYQYLFKNDVVSTNFKYPTYQKMMNRIVITANHTQNDLEKLTNLLHQI